MSAQPKPLYELVREWRAWEVANWDTFTDQAIAVSNRADELEAALKAWAEQIPDDLSEMRGWWVRERVLGVEDHGEVKTNP